MSTPIIEKGIPIPNRTYSRRIDWRNILRKMESGDSVVTDKISSIKRASYDLGIELITRQERKGYYRVWKT